ncbi:sugar ABC transporter permease [Brachybacterium sp. J144]|uniref:carbohydrate ABC transporter permease n=1 Tax=Brachybacterium sp. J144 TaxID=3116487 RepID=UPI002E788A23|nr:sugar ABC transporter permease [Brachybacterium sp. J144]MEE1651913.1 sugar ABC transporter permease [Brachybacterium sp. J144]
MAAVPVAGPSGATSGTRRARARLTPSRLLFFALFLGLPLLLYGLFVVWPVLQAVVFSFTNWRGYAAAPEFIGLDNYIRLFKDDTFLRALRNNLILLVALPTVVISLAFALAVLVTVGGDSKGEIRGVRGASIYRVVSFFPYVIPAVVVGILFAFVYSPNGGLLNGMLGLIGLDHGIGWLGDRRFALAAIVAAVVWSLVGFYMVLFVAAIKAIPSEVVEAARLDGCGRVRLAVQIILPMVRENVSTAVVYMGIMALDMFVYINVMTPNGGTGKSTEVISRYLYETAFQKSQFGLASAMGVVLALVTMLMAVIVLFGVGRKGDA